MHELQLAFRRLTRRPAPVAASLVALACSIGAAAATWSVISAALLHPVHVEDADRLFVVGERIQFGRQAGTLQDSHVYPLFQLIRDSGVFDRTAAGGSWPLPVTSNAGSGMQTAYFASHDFFDVLAVRIRVGRGFTAEEDRRGAALVAVLSDAFWRQAFGADPGVIGRDMVINGHSATVIGVVERAFHGIDLASPPAVYLPLHTAAEVGYPLYALTNYFADTGHASSPTAWVTIVGRVRAGERPAQVLSKLAALREQVGRPLGPLGLTAIETAALPAAARAGMRQFTTLLGATVGLLLLAGCLTVGMLLLVRTEARRDEFAMCVALGASRARLAAGIGLEGALMAVAGVALSVPVSWWLFRSVEAFQLPGRIRLDSLRLAVDATSIAAACACAAAGTIVIGLVAGVFTLRADLGDAIRSRSGATPRITRRRTRAGLAALQIAVAFVLVAGAGLFARSLAAALSLNPGIDTSRLIVAHNVSPRTSAPAAADSELAAMIERLVENPAIASASLTSTHGGMTAGGRLTVDNLSREMPSFVSFRTVGDRYFSTLGLRLLYGRNFSVEDRERSPAVAIVSDSFARLIAGSGQAVGLRLEMPIRRPPAPPPSVTIVGVVSDVVTNVNELQPLTVYFPRSQPPMDERRASADVVLRAAGAVKVARREATAAITQVDPSVTESRLSAFDDQMARQMGPQRFGAAVLGSLGFVALLLALLGTYVLAETMTVARMREMGIRSALGATGRQLAAVVLAETGRLIGFGLIAGFVLAWSGANAIRALLYHVAPLDPMTLAAAGSTIAAMALVVSVGPALHAARANVAVLLRQE